MTTRTAQILAALRSGAATSEEIASRVRSDRQNVSVALCRLAALGLVERAGVVNAHRIGRPYVRWRSRR
jgi:predicted transcriptional regulator